MKKSLLSLSIVLSFTLYVVATRSDGFNIFPVSAEKKDNPVPTPSFSVSYDPEPAEVTPTTPEPSSKPVATKPQVAPGKKIVTKAPKISPTPVTIPPLSTTSNPSTPTTTPLPDQKKPTSTATGTPAGSKQIGVYKDGTYEGSIASTPYGNVQVEAVIKKGKIDDINVLQFPSSGNSSVEINAYAMPLLITEAIKIQSAEVDVVSGATDLSFAFRESLETALHAAQD